MLFSGLRRPVLRLLVERGLQSGHVCDQIRQGGRDEPQDWPRLQELDPQARQETRKYFKIIFHFHPNSRRISGWERPTEEFPGERTKPGGFPKGQGSRFVVNLNICVRIF